MAFVQGSSCFQVRPEPAPADQSREGGGLLPGQDDQRDVQRPQHIHLQDQQGRYIPLWKFRRFLWGTAAVKNNPSGFEENVELASQKILNLSAQGDGEVFSYMLYTTPSSISSFANL